MSNSSISEKCEVCRDAQASSLFSCKKLNNETKERNERGMPEECKRNARGMQEECKGNARGMQEECKRNARGMQGE